MLETIALLTTLIWPITEVGLAFRLKAQGKRTRRVKGGGAGILWLVAVSGTLLALLTRFLGILPIPSSGQTLALVAAVLILAAVSMRMYAVVTLSRFFTVDVAVRRDHQLVTSGLYRYVRHPGYTGLLLGFLGVGLISGTWLGLALATLPFATILVHRIKVEESALGGCFGTAYQKYCRTSKRLIPYIY